MILNEKNCKFFNINETGMSDYDDILNNPIDNSDNKNLAFIIKWMRPSEYIYRCAKDIFRVNYNRLFNHRNDYKIKKYSDMMKNGIKFDMPMLNYAMKSQEGLHRAIAAMNINKDNLIPVMIVYYNVPIGKFIPTK